jgi:hypothetical protein
MPSDDRWKGVRRALIALFIMGCLFAACGGLLHVRLYQAVLTEECVYYNDVPPGVDPYAFPKRTEVYDPPEYGYRCVFEGLDGQEVATEHPAGDIALFANGGPILALVSGLAAIGLSLHQRRKDRGPMNGRAAQSQ